MRKMWMTLIVFIFLMVSGSAQAQTQPAEMRFLQPTASLSGNTGLWKIHSATNLPRGGAAFSAWADRINRNPGQLTITTYGFGGSAGLTNWLELGINFEVNRRVLMRVFEETSFGQQSLGLFGSQVPGAFPTPSQLMPGSTLMPQLRSPATPTGALTGRAGYFNSLPFVSRNQGNGVGTVAVGFKIGILNENDGGPFSLGVRTYAHIPTHRSATFLKSRPSQSGGWIVGSDFLLGKGIGNAAELNFSGGYRGMQSPDGGRIVVLSDIVPLGFGITAPRYTRLQFMGELAGEILVGDHTPNTVPDSENVVDLTVGFRAFLNRYLNLSAGYRRPLNQDGGDKNGFVFQLGYTYGPPMDVTPPSPPSVSCSADPVDAQPGSTIRLSASGSSSTGAPLTYEWSTNAGTIQGTGQSVSVSTTGVAPGGYVATVRVTEAPGLFADCSARFNIVQPPPPQLPPTASCTAAPQRVQVGEVVNLSVQGASPQNRPLTYSWSVTRGSVVGSGPSVRLDTTGAQPGTITATATVTDDRNLTATCTSTVTVDAPPPPPPAPQVSMLDTCQFGLNSARVDNVCKAKLDSVALRLQSEPDASLTVVGFAASNERNAQQLSQTRADNVRAYLANDKGIAQGRLVSRTGAAGTGVAARKAEMYLVPRGATFVGYNIRLDTERMRAAQGTVPALSAPAIQAKPVASGSVRPAAAKPAAPDSARVRTSETGGKRIIASLR